LEALMVYGDIPEPGTDEFKKAVQQGRWARELDAEIQSPNWTPPERPTTLYDQLADGVPEIDYVVEELMTGIVQLNAQKKAGKTTLAMNIVRSMLIGEPLLGRFCVNTTEDDRIAYLNMELSNEQMLNWFADMQLTDAALKRLA
jgi:RecA-family ATPase